MDTGYNTAPGARGVRLRQPRRAGAATAELFDDSSACTLTAQETEGPNYFDADSIRSD